MEDEKDPKEYEAECLADAQRRAHDEELEMLANIAIIRSTMLGRSEQMTEERGSDGKARQMELERRLRFRMHQYLEQNGETETNVPRRSSNERGRPLGKG